MARQKEEETQRSLKEREQLLMQKIGLTEFLKFQKDEMGDDSFQFNDSLAIDK